VTIPAAGQWLLLASHVAALLVGLLFAWEVLEGRYKALITRLQGALAAREENVGQHPWVPEEGYPHGISEMIAREVVHPSLPGEGLSAIIGQWPGDETDEQVREGLQLLEDSAEVAAIREVLGLPDGFVTVHAMTAGRDEFAYCADTPDLSAQIITACKVATEAAKREETP
jgi:hypothetical protein